MKLKWSRESRLVSLQSNCSLSNSASLTACTAAQAAEEGSLHVRKIASYCSMNNPTGSNLAVCHSKLNIESNWVRFVLHGGNAVWSLAQEHFQIRACSAVGGGRESRGSLAVRNLVLSVIVNSQLAADQPFKVERSGDTCFRCIPSSVNGLKP